MKRVVIGIHGLANKPEKSLLSGWWKAAIREGLQRIGYGGIHFHFQMCYWAHHIYPIPKTGNVF